MLGGMNSSVSLLTAAVVGVVAYGLGYVHAVCKRAWIDYKVAKDAVPAARKNAWASIPAVLRFGVGAAVVAAVLLTWSVRDVSDDTKTPLVPAKAKPSASAKPAKK
jgi:hypothetical protein